uniref:Uncharacterized protein n=1 Tax=Rhizophora mucronata TaxID=61149 RepID=A0A2P2PBM3_RHIMU
MLQQSIQQEQKTSFNLMKHTIEFKALLHFELRAMMRWFSLQLSINTCLGIMKFFKASTRTCPGKMHSLKFEDIGKHRSINIGR